MQSKLTHEFYNRNVVDVAKDLLGKKLIFYNSEYIITETEAYGGYDDEASHAFHGVTKRSAIMFDNPGNIYVYMIYGIYYCLNIVTDAPGKASAVLIRGIALPNLQLDGPGKLCRHLGITKSHNKINLLENDNMYLTEGIRVSQYTTTTRIGIQKAKEKLWRFFINTPCSTLSLSSSKKSSFKCYSNIKIIY